MKSITVALGAIVVLSFAAGACGDTTRGANEEQIGNLEDRIEGLEAALARSGAMAAIDAATIFPDTLSCNDEESYTDSVARTYTITNNCEFSAYVQVYDTAGNFVRQERISGYDSGSVSVGPFESIEVRCSYVIASGSCTVTRR